jgi:predicted dehydrogenase
VGETIVETAELHGTLLMVGYHKRSDPAIMHAKTLIEEWKESGEFGRLTYIRILMPAGDWIAHGFDELVHEEDEVLPLEEDPAPEDLDEHLFKDYVSFVNYYIHQVNLLRHLFGEKYEVVFADDQGLLMAGRCASGAMGIIEMSPYRTTIDWQEEVLVCFERGWIRIFLPPPLAANQAGRIEVYRDPGNGRTPSLTSPTLCRIHAMKQQCLNFLAAIRGEQPPMTDAAEALEDLRLARDYIRKKAGL